MLWMLLAGVALQLFFVLRIALMLVVDPQSTAFMRSEAWRVAGQSLTEDKDLKLACFCTAPAVRDTLSNLTSEIIGTFLLVFAVLFLAVSVFGLGALDALPVGLLVLAIGLGLGGTTGYAINPARDLGPRIVHAILPMPGGKRDSDWRYAWIPVVGPLIGAGVAGVLYLVLKDPSNINFR